MSDILARVVIAKAKATGNNDTMKQINVRKNIVQRFFAWEAADGIILMAAAVIALIIDNSSMATLYHAGLDHVMNLSVGDYHISKTPIFWIDDGLMVLFFFLVGLELKREMVEGHLATVSEALLPVVAAVGGMVCPALIYISMNANDPIALQGWAVPVATDIAFALAALSLLGSRIPVGLKVFLTVLAIVDDIGAIIIIAIAHTDYLSILSLFLAGCVMSILIVCNRMHLRFLSVYLLLGVMLWACVLESGVHATLAGVVLAMVIPMEDSEGRPMLRVVEKTLKPFVMYGVLPLFALTNAGISFEGLQVKDIFNPISFGIMMSLFFGKQLGVFMFTYGLVKLKFARLPLQATWLHVYGISVLCGIGFTMSLFMGTLAFAERGPLYMTEVRLGV